MPVSQKDLDKCLVVNFCHGERTIGLSDFCFEKLGFKNRINLSGNSGFHEKFLEFADIAVDSKYEYFLRNDADRLVFDGILEVFKMMIDDSSISWSSGSFFDYLMNRFRIGTPSIHRRDCLEFLVKNKHMMKDVQKPEATFAIAIQGMFNLKDVKTLTNLHEYEQYPSKVCNAFLNRLARNHYPHLYDNQYLNNLPDHYKSAISHAFETFENQGHKNSMVHQDFAFLDNGFSPIEKEELETLYEKYKEKYDKLKKKQPSKI